MTLTVGQRISLGFAVVLSLLVVAGVLSYIGVGGMVTSANSVVEGNKLDGELAQKEIDHLNWANKVSALLTDDNVTTLDVQLDPRQCAFGKWLYGDERKAAETDIPEIAPLLKEIETYHADLHASAGKIKECFRQADPALPATLCQRENDHLAWADRVKDLFVRNLPKLEVQTDPTQCAFGKWLNSEDARKAAAADPEFAKTLEACRTPHDRLHQSAVAIQQSWRKANTGLRNTLKDRLEDHRAWAAKVCQACAMEDANFEVETDPTKCGFGKFLESDQCRQWCEDSPELKAALEACHEPHEKLHASAITIKEAFQAGDNARAKQVYVDETVPAMQAVVTNFRAAIEAENAIHAAQAQARQVLETETLPALAETREKLHACREHAEHAVAGMKQAGAIFASQTKPNLVKVQEILKSVRDVVHKHVVAEDAKFGTTAQATRRNVLLTGAVALAVGAALAFLIARSLVKILKRLIASLDEGANQLNEAAGQVASASQQLAEGASEQASSLEETSSALEQLSAMTKTNAENAHQADALAGQARTAASDGEQTVGKLNEAMSGINEASDRISKIIKVIEEIAFQTNLLALNAAVEAARAGEHGKGFAVVAEEVRNLAQRAAAAAGETTQLISESVNRARDGTAVSQSVSEALGSITNGVGQVAQLIDGIARASNEQSTGIGQITEAVTQMDKVTQSNAGGAEEAASAAEQLSAQSATVKGIVGELVAIVSGSRAQEATISEQATSAVARRQASRSTVRLHAQKSHAPATAIAETDQPHSGDNLGDF